MTEGKALSPGKVAIKLPMRSLRDEMPSSESCLASRRRTGPSWPLRPDVDMSAVSQAFSRSCAPLFVALVAISVPPRRTRQPHELLGALGVDGVPGVAVDLQRRADNAAVRDLE